MHLAAAAAAALGLALLVYLGRDSVSKQTTLVIYGLSVIAMFAASATYHLVNASPATLQFLRKLDHSAIYLIIWQWGMVALIWLFALVGILVKLVFLHAPRWLTVVIYLVMGWLGLVAIPEMVNVMPPGAIAWLLAGGFFFTLGALVYALKKPDWYPNVFGFHELWHIFVILGVLCHFILIAAYIAPRKDKNFLSHAIKKTHSARSSECVF
ncbi:MAG: hemolysin III family channel protein [Chloroflexi bacterium]|nr:MAG: hemolysin III family channel protein [Chloroflexota bacterium]